MKKNKPFIFLSTITLVFIFGSAATCNFCGTPVRVGETNKTEETSLKEEINDKNTTTTKVSEDTGDTSAETSRDEGEHEAPTLSIFISEGPLYSEADDVCYYIISSELYGNPYPELTWSKNDSSSLPQDKTQVNLNRGETYTLIATATNSVDTVTETLELVWGCDGNEVADGDVQDEEMELQSLEARLPVVLNETGRSFTGGLSQFKNDAVEAGDTTSNTDQQGFVSFDITAVSEATITSANLAMFVEFIEGDISFFNKFHIGTYDWGEGTPNQADLLEAVSAKIGEFEINIVQTGDIVCSNQALKQEIQRAIDEGKTRFRIKVYFSGSVSDNDNTIDSIVFFPDNIFLDIKYNN